jgi:hypothetical protein
MNAFEHLLLMVSMLSLLGTRPLKAALRVLWDCESCDYS